MNSEFDVNVVNRHVEEIHRNSSETCDFSRLLVALCFTVLVLAGALAIGSLAGWFHPGFTEPVPAKLSQIAHIKVRDYYGENS
ncbi:hypothetical protein GWI33_021992 [Rhynchophorus ferrugineus]|uniref:Uncharacterized protein n=1 Tax=Rhynchophorus ferrugineus TaxID=354439 RepID=A0A834IT91_RHYFE|nr:hypothetical protein GWI33_021992 [Rhynchophorus ferrugineus]